MPLFASRERRIEYLRVSVTDRCNLRCAYCVPRGRFSLAAREELLTDAEMVRVIRVSARTGIRKVRLTGGEPLVRPGILDLVAEVASIPGIEDLAMTTNATLLSLYAEKLKEAGLKRVNVSLDTLDPALFRRLTGRQVALERVVEGIMCADRAGLYPLKLNTVVMRGVNEGELGRLARFALERGWHIRFIEYMPLGADSRRWEELYLPAEEVESLLVRELGELEPAGEEGVSREFRVSGYEGTIGIISPISQHFCDRCNRLRLTADGRIRSCLLKGGEVDVRSLLRGGAGEEEIEEALRRAAGLKPDWHGVEKAWEAARDRLMSQIGG